MEKSPNVPGKALVDIERERTGKDPLQGTGQKPDGSFDVGPKEHDEDSRH